MLKKIAINVGIGVIVCAAGIIGYNATYSSYESRSGFELLIYGGLWYAGIALGVGALIGVGRIYKTSRPYVDQALTTREKEKAYDELMRMKKLRDENIISQEEFDAKVRELKIKML
jgi:hypothetical protein